jgi:2-desacetyl-2-hydroxyethyl bacteriochlorophyllide A dehydrogenase
MTQVALQLTAPREFRLTHIPRPTAPAAGHALVGIRSMGVCGTDIAGYLGKMPFIEFPRILGHELGVEVSAVAGVSDLQPGDRCSVEPYLNCGHCHPCRQGLGNCCESLAVLGVHCDGGLCETLSIPLQKLHRRNDLSFDQLALVEMLGIGCHAVNRAAVTAGETVLILGAGPIGMSVLEFALLAGAQVSLWDPNPIRSAFVRRTWPSVEVLSEPPAELAAQSVFDATGHPGSMAQALRYARFTGKIVYVGITKEPVTLDDPLFHRRELTLLASRNALPTDFPHIQGLIASGKLNTTPWISHRADFADVPEAMREWTAPGSDVVKAIIHVS